MKRTVVFLLTFLFLVVVSISGTGNNAFAWHGSPPSPQVAVLVCSVSGATFTVTALSNDSTVTGIGVNDDCATDLVKLEGAGLKIKDIQVVTGSISPTVIYTLVNGLYGL